MARFLIHGAVALSSIVTVASALSTNCTSTLSSIASSNASSCLNLDGLLPLTSLSSSDNIIPPVDSWITGMCGKDACSNDTINNIFSSVSTGCSADLKSYNITPLTLDIWSALITPVYPVAREALCLRNTTANNQLCVTGVLTAIQDALGTPLTTSAINSRASQLLDSNTTLSKSIACSQCAQVAYGIISAALEDELAAQLKASFSQECSDSFVSGGKPSNIIVATGSLATMTPTPSVVATGSSATATPTSSSKTGGAASLTVSMANMLVPMSLAFVGMLGFIVTAL